MTISVKERLESRISVGQTISFLRLFNIVKSLGHTTYIELNNSVTIIGAINPKRYPRSVKIIDIFEEENQIWSMGKMIMSTWVKIEGIP